MKCKNHSKSGLMIALFFCVLSLSLQAPEPQTESLWGFEVTFSNRSLRGQVIHGDRGDDATFLEAMRRLTEASDRFVNAIRNQQEQHARVNLQQFPTNNDYNCSIQTAAVFPDKAHKLTFPDGFWMLIAIDDGCLEVTAKPVTVEELKRQEPRIQKVIFDTAYSLGLDVVYVGGGHLHNDFNRSFRSPCLTPQQNAVKFRNSFVYYSLHPSFAQGILSRRIDYTNNPPLAMMLRERNPGSDRDIILPTTRDIDTALGSRPPTAANLNDVIWGAFTNLISEFDRAVAENRWTEAEWGAEALATKINERIYRRFGRLKPLVEGKFNAINLMRVALQGYDFRTQEYRILDGQTTAGHLVADVLFHDAILNHAEALARNGQKVELGGYAHTRPKFSGTSEVLADFDRVVSELKLPARDFADYPWLRRMPEREGARAPLFLGTCRSKVSFVFR